jgi:hypothetical protein
MLYHVASQHHHVYLILYHGIIDGSLVRKITTDPGYNYNLLYNERNDQLLLRQDERLCCINLDGHVIYRL